MDVRRPDPCAICGSDQHRSREHDVRFEPLRIDPKVEAAYLKTLATLRDEVACALALPPSFFNGYFRGSWRVTVGQPQTCRFVPAPYYSPAPAFPEPRWFEYADRDEEFKQP